MIVCQVDFKGFGFDFHGSTFLDEVKTNKKTVSGFGSDNQFIGSKVQRSKVRQQDKEDFVHRPETSEP
jgi:hypothetical protein